MKKILLFLGNEYFSQYRTGVGKYHENILYSLDCDYTLAIDRQNNLMDTPWNCHILRMSHFKRKIISILKFIIPIEFFFNDYNIILTDSFSFFSFNKSKKIYMIVHDCMSFTESQNYTIRQKLFSRISALTYKRADLIIAVSQTTKQTLHSIFKIPYSKIQVIPNVTDFYVQNVPSNFYLFIGDMRKTKNLDVLILGFKNYLEQYSCNEKLIIAGNKKNEYLKLNEIVISNKLENKIDFPGYIDENTKIKLFSKAKGFVFLSDNEGFGIPLLEAAVNKIPVLCSDIPVFREVLSEDFAIFVNNKNIQAIADGFYLLSKKTIEENKAEVLRKRYSRSVFKSEINRIL